jgi:beta-lactamase class A
MSSLSGLGTRRRGNRLPILALASGGFLLAGLILGALQLVRFAATRDVLQTDITVGGVPVGGLPLAQAVKTWETIYAQPVEIDYGNSPILLYPSQLGFFVKSDQLRSQVQSRAAGTNSYWLDFWNYLWQLPAAPVDIPLASDYQAAKLRDFLNDLAARYEVHASGVHFDLSTMTFGSGANGAHIDIEAALPLIEKALERPTSRKVALPLKTEGARNSTMQTLHDALIEYMKNASYLGNKGISFNGPQTAGGVMVIDMQSGQEMTINGDVAFSSLSTVKIPILLNFFRVLGDNQNLMKIDDNWNGIRWQLASSIVCSNNDASNSLIQESSSSGTDQISQLKDGLQQVVATTMALGAKNTYVDAPIDVGDPKLHFSIGAPKTNPDKTVNAHADPYSQTTASDMATLLKELYDCATYGSGVRTFFPDRYTQLMCKRMIELMSGDITGRLIELGVPQGTRIAHKNGWGVDDGGNVSDAAIVYSPGGTYILVVYLWETYTQNGVGSLDLWQAVEGLSRVTYNFFNPDQPLTTPRVPDNPNGAVGCVMPNLDHPERINLDHISSGRFDANGYILPDACYDFPHCTNGGQKLLAPPPPTAATTVAPTIAPSATFATSPPTTPTLNPVTTAATASPPSK